MPKTSNLILIALFFFAAVDASAVTRRIGRGGCERVVSLANEKQWQKFDRYGALPEHERLATPVTDVLRMYPPFNRLLPGWLLKRVEQVGLSKMGVLVRMSEREFDDLGVLNGLGMQKFLAELGMHFRTAEPGDDVAYLDFGDLFRARIPATLRSVFKINTIQELLDGLAANPPTLTEERFLKGRHTKQKAYTALLQAVANYKVARLEGGKIDANSFQQIAQAQAENKNRYLRQVYPKMAAQNPYYTLPGGIPARLRPGMQALFDLTRNPLKTFALLQRLELDVARLAESDGTNLEQALAKYLAGEERHFGFQPAEVLTRYMEHEEFLDFISRGVPISDQHWFDKPHTRDGHRVQSIIEAQYIDSLFGPQLYVELYREMGNVAHMKQLDWKGTGLELETDASGKTIYLDLFGYLHDVPVLNHPAYRRVTSDFTNPEFFASLRKYLPGLAGWK